MDYDIVIDNIDEVNEFCKKKMFRSWDIYGEFCIKIKYIYKFSISITFKIELLQFNLVFQKISHTKKEITYVVKSIYNCYLEEYQYYYEN